MYFSLFSFWVGNEWNLHCTSDRHNHRPHGCWAVRTILCWHCQELIRSFTMFMYFRFSVYSLFACPKCLHLSLAARMLCSICEPWDSVIAYVFSWTIRSGGFNILFDATLLFAHQSNIQAMQWYCTRIAKRETWRRGVVDRASKEDGERETERIRERKEES